MFYKKNTEYKKNNDYFTKNKFYNKKIIVLLSLISLFTLNWCNNIKEAKINTENNNNIVNWNKIIKTEKITNNTNKDLNTLIENKEYILNKYNWNYKGNTVISNFNKSKHYLYKIYWSLNNDYKKTIYCWCNFNWKKVYLNSCWLKTKGYKNRINRIEREHIVPAENFGRYFKSWRLGNKLCKYYSKSKKKYIYYKGRKCAEKVNPLFNLMEADLYNLAPSDWALNAYRSNYQIAEISWEKKKFGKCDFEIDFKNRKMEPPQNRKWDIARTYMYMQLIYWKKKGLKIISNKNKKLIEIWNKEDQIDKYECTIYYKKKEIQKNINPILNNTCKKIMWY